MLLIAAVLAAGGIFLLDTFHLAPHVNRQHDTALREQAARTAGTGRTALTAEKARLQASCTAWAHNSSASAFLEPGGTGEQFDALIEAEIKDGQADLAWVTDLYGHVTGLWVRYDYESISGAKGSLRSALEALGPALCDILPLPETGLVKIDSQVAIFARRLVSRSYETGHAPLGNLWVARILDAATLKRVGSAIGAGLVLVGSDTVPSGAIADESTTHAWWPTGTDTLVVAWPAYDATGTALACFRADLSVVHINRQASGARRMILIVLWLSVALMLLVIVAIHIFIAGPVVRLLRKLQTINTDRDAFRDLTHSLHGEPRVLARRLESAFDKLEHMSQTDELTGMANRRHFEEVLDCFYHQARRYNRPLSLIVIDVDFFKAVNDAGGHQAGDNLLKCVAETVEQACRKADLPARFGGDEFAILLPETSVDDAAGMAERIREALAHAVHDVNGIEVKVTASLGITDLNAGAIDSPRAMLALADRALYAAKEAGRNRVVLAHELDGIEQSENGVKVNSLCKKLAGLDDRFKALFLQAIEEIMGVLEQRDSCMADHARKVQHYSVLLAREMGLPDRFINRIEIAAMLHDIGMLAMPDSVILCPHELAEQSSELMQKHPLYSVRIMEGMEFLEQEIPTVRYHHERMDGKGYPEGLVGSAIPLTARILAVADAFDALTSSRTYRGAKLFSEALAELKIFSGTQFDPAVVEAFVNLAERMGEDLMHLPPSHRGEEQGSADREPAEVQA